ncbi:LamB/YcsF family protein [Neobacillus niacini]|uniref:LamB/YcsF family protein n=1 Tax=Neobacillus niacini TaxID=86668 RepID=UPI00052F6169|nr:5-oxoprolinase subunit PxpA [Neobacillus niacini]KGM45789.1 LamB/YcsF family protein [Neobacillus niacini]MEC1521279.1 LamB/YcsF family protein [Neobacillus niacini]
MSYIDINCDLGESYGLFKIGNDKEVLKHISSANIACGYHAGDHNVMMETIQMAKKYHVNIGAHPGFPDILGFGRREMNVSTREIYNLTLYQMGALSAFAKAEGVKLVHVKPHGALYNMAAKSRLIADSIAQAVADFDSTLILFGLSGSELIQAGKAKGLNTAQEVFADRTYQPDGSLTSRNDENSMIHDMNIAAQRIIRMIREGKVATTDGTDIAMTADTVCVHGDEPAALNFITELKHALTKENIEIRKSWPR